MTASFIFGLANTFALTGWISRRVMEVGLPRLLLIILLPLTFMFGPAGFLAFQICRLAFLKVEASQ